MNKIEELTDEQVSLMESVAAEYELVVLGGDDSYDPDISRQGIDLVYSLVDLKTPEIVVCSSPLDMARQANLKKGETIDYIGCGYDSGWTSFLDYFQRIGIEVDDEKLFDTWRDFILKSGVFATVLCENVAFVCLRPCAVNRNATGDLHNPAGPAIAWRDGYKEYALNGVWVEEALVMTPAEKLDPAIALKEKNAEVRREIIRKIGIERLVLKTGARVIGRLGEYELLDLNLGEDRYRPYLKMKNPSIGTWHVEGVHPDCKTVQQALNWRAYRDVKKHWDPATLT